MLRTQIIQEVSNDLNDQVTNYEYTHWTTSQLRSYLQEALLMCAHTFKEIFYKKLIVTLDPHQIWQASCDNCTEIITVYGEVDEQNRLIKTFRIKDDDSVYDGSVLKGQVCKSSDYNADSELFAYTINKVDFKSFRVYGDLKPTETGRRVLIECYQQPDINLKDIPDRLVGIIKQWMLYRALIVDSENNATIQEIAKTHLQTYTLLLTDLQHQQQQLEARRNEQRDLRPQQNDTSREVSTRT